jgi:hypothetical protein
MEVGSKVLANSAAAVNSLAPAAEVTTGLAHSSDSNHHPCSAYFHSFCLNLDQQGSRAHSDESAVHFAGVLRSMFFPCWWAMQLEFAAFL